MSFKPTHSLYEHKWLRFIGIHMPLVLSNSKSSFFEMTFPILMSPHVILACAKTYTDVIVFICESAKVFSWFLQRRCCHGWILKMLGNGEFIWGLRLLYFGTKLAIRIRKTTRLPRKGQDPLAFVRPEDFNENHIRKVEEADVAS
jgi:hypothetical protein